MAACTQAYPCQGIAGNWGGAPETEAQVQSTVEPSPLKEESGEHLPHRQVGTRWEKGNQQLDAEARCWHLVWALLPFQVLRRRTRVSKQLFPGGSFVCLWYVCVMCRGRCCARGGYHAWATARHLCCHTLVYLRRSPPPPRPIFDDNRVLGAGYTSGVYQSFSGRLPVWPQRHQW